MRVLAITNIYPTPHNPTSGTFVEQQIRGLRQIGVEVDIMLVDRAQKGMRAYVGLGAKALNKVNEVRADLVHVMYGGVMAYQVMRVLARRRPVMVTFHGSDLLGERLSGISRRIISGYGVRASWAAARRATGVVTVSESLKNSLPADVDRSKIRVVPCGIDLDLFKPIDRVRCRTQLGWAPDVFHILFAANTGDPVKRPELAQAAVEIFGQRGIRVEMHYLRGVPYKFVPVWLNASDCLLLTSLHEGSPTIVKEALACNLPVVSVNVGDVDARIRGIAGCYLALSDPADLAAKLFMVHSGLREVAGRTSVRDLSTERVARCLEEFYRATAARFHVGVSVDKLHIP